MTTTLRKRVERGAALLDKKYRGKAWRKKIDLDKLKLWSPCDCVLGQIYGRYRKGFIALGLKRWSMHDGEKEHGFFPGSGDDKPLIRAWRKYIEATR